MGRGFFTAGGVQLTAEREVPSCGGTGEHAPHPDGLARVRLVSILVRLPPEEADALRDLARRTRIRQAEYLREAVRDVLAKYDVMISVASVADLVVPGPSRAIPSGETPKWHPPRPGLPAKPPAPRRVLHEDGIGAAVACAEVGKCIFCEESLPPYTGGRRRIICGAIDCLRAYQRAYKRDAVRFGPRPHRPLPEGM